MAHNDTVPGSASGSGTSSNSGFHVPNLQLGDTTFTKLFVGGLAWETQNESLRRHFEQYGDILEAVVIADKRTGRSKGYGFVTFADPESARRACEDSTPVIDGRRANCNLASLGRHQAAPSYEHLRLMGPYFGGVPVPRGAFVGSSGYYQPIIYDYQQGFTYPPYGYMMYGTQFVNPQNIYGTSGTQFVQARRVAGTANQSTYSFRQFSQPLAGRYDYSMIPGYEMPSHQFLQLRGPYLNGASAEPIPLIQAPYSPGIAGQVPAQPWTTTVSARPPRFAQDRISGQMED